MKLIRTLIYMTISLFLVSSCTQENNPVSKPILSNNNSQSGNIKEVKIPEPEIIIEPEPIDFYKDSTLIPYEGDVEHIFFHPLVAYPERAFDGDYGAQGMDNYMATATECKRLLEEVHKNGYVLVDINKVYDFVLQEDGTSKMQRINFLFPENKKPLVISLDDVNYYPYMINDGCNYKLILDDKNKLATYSEDLNGNPVVSYDTEVMTIVEEFVKNNPDFSFQNARGVIGLTGYEGILGYRTQEGSPNREEEIKKVKPVIEKLKKLGWTFASHSYGHPHMAKQSFELFKKDTDDWKREVEPLVGETRVFLYPYGEFIKHNDVGMAKINYLIDEGGFDIHCGVSVITYATTYDRYAFEERKNIDGLTLRNQKHRIQHMFNPDYVIDIEARGY